jgi:hypothetical protein
MDLTLLGLISARGQGSSAARVSARSRALGAISDASARRDRTCSSTGESGVKEKAAASSSRRREFARTDPPLTARSFALLRVILWGAMIRAKLKATMPLDVIDDSAEEDCTHKRFALWD